MPPPGHHPGGGKGVYLRGTGVPQRDRAGLQCRSRRAHVIDDQYFFSMHVMPAKPCAAGTGKATQRSRLAGTWIFIKSKTRFPDACQGDTGITYEADGTYQLLEESGTWRLKGDRLTETPTEAHEGAQPGSVKIGEPFTSRLQWQGPDTFTKTHPGGKITLRRCP